MSPDEEQRRLERHYESLLQTYGALEKEISRMQALIEERTADMMRARDRVDATLGALDAEKADARDVQMLRDGQREAFAEMRAMLKETFRTVDETCKNNVLAVRGEVEELKRLGERAVWSRADKLSAAGLVVLIVLTSLGMVLR